MTHLQYFLTSPPHRKRTPQRKEDQIQRTLYTKHYASSNQRVTNSIPIPGYVYNRKHANATVVWYTFPVAKYTMKMTAEFEKNVSAYI